MRLHLCGGSEAGSERRHAQIKEALESLKEPVKGVIATWTNIQQVGPGQRAEP